MSKKTPEELSAIAQKAVATRRAREAEEKDKRHKAAVKAWETRRAQAGQVPANATTADKIDKWMEAVEQGKLTIKEVRAKVRQLVKN